MPSLAPLAEIRQPGIEALGSIGHYRKCSRASAGKLCQGRMLLTAAASGGLAAAQPSSPLPTSRQPGQRPGGISSGLALDSASNTLSRNDDAAQQTSSPDTCFYWVPGPSVSFLRLTPLTLIPIYGFVCGVQRRCAPRCCFHVKSGVGRVLNKRTVQPKRNTFFLFLFFSLLAEISIKSPSRRREHK